MRIAICDDDKNELNNMILLLEKYKKEHTVMFTYQAFQSEVELLATAKAGDYSLYLLDVIMPVINGMEVAKEIRSFDTDVKIVFLTSSPEFAVASYNVKAMDYILKPVCEKRLFSVLDEFLQDSQKPQEGLTIKAKNGMTRILFSRLSYVEVINKQVYFHLSDKSVRKVTARLVEFEQALLARPEFKRTHRSYIVNLYQIDQLTQREIITHQGNNIPVSRTLYKEVRDAYIRQLFWKEGVQ
ncbi:LytTR family DNA-binding domain-containing protein [Paludicola sp. MB14-C6]|uniref:LytR/AlgR family response regulator transcription factor n=1 Tax=Paludihabitans sp. MB14-C6 TaxID=3070656 RepID=UPI0027DC3A6E|nr:LytTR family DNA-binding domain-containing protein [Paludicola sp. MB14-C6]WMJ21914.1 LytTR family DNA-binding domain-containing protein [Paludicola sp. MB14-C6]